MVPALIIVVFVALPDPSSQYDDLQPAIRRTPISDSLWAKWCRYLVERETDSEVIIAEFN